MIIPNSDLARLIDMSSVAKSWAWAAPLARRMAPLSPAAPAPPAAPAAPAPGAHKPCVHGVCFQQRPKVQNLATALINGQDQCWFNGSKKKNMEILGTWDAEGKHQGT